MTRSETILFFPGALPDETLFSWISQYHVVSGNLTSAQTFMELFGGCQTNPDRPEVQRLESLNRALPSAMRMTTEQITDRLTLCPFYSAFEEAARATGCSSLLEHGYWTRNGITRARVLRLCPICIDDDVRLFGRPYWHRAHQLPAVDTCWKHSDGLIERCPVCGVRLAKRGGLFLPSKFCQSGHLLITNERDSDVEWHRWFATLCRDLLWCKTHVLSWDAVKSHFLTACAAQGRGTRCPKPKINRIKAICRYYQKELCLYFFERRVPPRALRRFLNPRQTAIHLTVCLLRAGGDF